MLRYLLGFFSLLLYLSLLVVMAAIVIIGSLLLFLIPVRSWRHHYQQYFLQRTPSFYARLNHWIMLISTHGRWDVQGTTTSLTQESWYVMIANHRSWIDILVLYNVFYNKIPSLKFFMKKELLWQLPLAGMACYVLGFPFMSRHSRAAIRKNPALKGHDIKTTQKACARLRAFPSTLINFIEGTRFTDKKKERQQSPFQHLLKPHAGGVAVAIQELNGILSGVINVVICYSGKTPTAWDFICGRFDKIVVRYEVLPITSDLIGDYYNDRNFRAHFQRWLNEVWTRNDSLITHIKASAQI